MKYSHKLSDAVHILAYVTICKDMDLSSSAISRSIESNPSLVRRLMAQLGEANLLESRPGAATPKLTRDAGDISLFDIYQAIEVDPRILHVDDKTNPRCIVGGNIQDTLNTVYDKLQKNMEQEMKQVSLQNIIDDILVREMQKQA